MKTEKQSLLKVLFCDDDSEFAMNQVENLSRKLMTRFGIKEQNISFETVTNLNTIQSLQDNPKHLKNFDLIFCDLGWADLTLKGVQLLHDIQLTHPKIYTVLYTAQDEDAVINQALRWQLDFIDLIIRIDGRNFFNKMLDCLWKQFQRKRINILHESNYQNPIEKTQYFLEIAQNKSQKMDEHEKISYEEIKNGFLFKDVFPECYQLLQFKDKLTALQLQKKQKLIEKLIEDIQSLKSPSRPPILGQNHLNSETKSFFLSQTQEKLKIIHKMVNELFSIDDHNAISLEILTTRTNTKAKIKPDVDNQTKNRFLSLIDKREKYPRIEATDLLALDKSLYIEFIKKNYGSFPQMAKKRNLDLNNIYRVNRRFKGFPFVVFQHDTIQEIIGIKEPKKKEQVILSLLATEEMILNAMPS